MVSVILFLLWLMNPGTHIALLSGNIDLSMDGCNNILISVDVLLNGSLRVVSSMCGVAWTLGNGSTELWGNELSLLLNAPDSSNLSKSLAVSLGCYCYLNLRYPIALLTTTSSPLDLLQANPAWWNSVMTLNLMVYLLWYLDLPIFSKYISIALSFYLIDAISIGTE